MNGDIQNINILAKLQKYLKNLHKFDKPMELYERIELLQGVFNRFINSLKEENPEKVENRIRDLIIEILNVANSRNIDVSEILRKSYNF